MKRKVFKGFCCYGVIVILVGSYVVRVRFKQGEQRKFLDLVIERSGGVSLRGLLQFGFDIKYSSLKSYYTERRLMDEEFFKNLCHIAKINYKNIDIIYVEDNWGQVRGGKKSRKSKAKIKK